MLKGEATMKLKEIRKERGIKQNQLSEMCGINQNTISRYETGTREPRLRDLQAMASALNCTLDELIGEPKTEEK